MARFAGKPLVPNADLGPQGIQERAALGVTGEGSMSLAVQPLLLSAREHHWILKAAGTIADLAGAEQVAAAHATEALQYRARHLVF